MTPNITQISRPTVPTIGKVKADNLLVGTWFIGREGHQSTESRLFVKAYDVVIDVQRPMSTYDGDVVFYDVKEVAVNVTYWAL